MFYLNGGELSTIQLARIARWDSGPERQDGD